MPQVQVLAQIFSEIKLDIFPFPLWTRNWKGFKLLIRKKKRKLSIQSGYKLGNQNNESIHLKMNSSIFRLQAILTQNFKKSLSPMECQWPCSQGTGLAGTRKTSLSWMTEKTWLEKGSAKQVAVFTRAFQHQLNRPLAWKTKMRSKKCDSQEC